MIQIMMRNGKGKVKDKITGDKVALREGNMKMVVCVMYVLLNCML
jgi:hypothetical protein